MNLAEVCTTVQLPVEHKARCYEEGRLTKPTRGGKEGLLTIKGLH